jgi:hypothetical protein
VFDGEIVCLDKRGRPQFPNLTHATSVGLDIDGQFFTGRKLCTGV